MKKITLTFVVAIISFLILTTTSQASGLPIGMVDLTSTGMWQPLAWFDLGHCGAGRDVWHYGQDTGGTCNFNNGFTNSGTLTTSSFSSVNTPVVTFDFWLDVEPGVGRWDETSLLLSVDGASTLLTKLSKDDMRNWHTVTMPLPQCIVPHNCIWTILFNTFDSTGNNGQGVYISNFSITAPAVATSTPTTTATSTMTPTSTPVNTSTSTPTMTRTSTPTMTPTMTPTPTSTPTDLGVTITEDDCVGGSVYILNSGPTSRSFRVKVTFDGTVIVDQSSTIVAGANTTVSWNWPSTTGSHQSVVDVWRDISVNLMSRTLNVLCPPNQSKIYLPLIMK